ncbi:hypothetical protein ACFQS1_11570 [Paractinoplanes rhizophilus]|uniref:Uncharacterized protein n=1 Tax=Paractinoplanes rhizophilus TaxID=1416877 RepID=A0ABW2HQF4_9ACTN
MRHRAARQALVAASLTCVLAGWTAPAWADVDGFRVTIGQAPGTITIGKQARTLTAVVATERERRCFRVRWTLVIKTQGISLDQIRVNRIENGRSFPVRAQLRDDEARVVDARADPGQLCRNRKVTGRWDISFVGPDDGRVTFEAQALDGGRKLSSAEASSRVVTAVAAKPSAGPSAAPSPDEEQEAVADDRAAPADDATSAAALNPASGTPSALGPGLIIGAVLVFLGVALLLRIRTRNRREAPAWQAETQALPTGFSSMPPPRRRRR